MAEDDDGDGPTGPPLGPQPGWYEDPDDVRRLRFWSGTRWTDGVRDAAGGPVSEIPATSEHGPLSSQPTSATDDDHTTVYVTAALGAIAASFLAAWSGMRGLTLGSLPYLTLAGTAGLAGVGLTTYAAVHAALGQRGPRASKEQP